MRLTDMFAEGDWADVVEGSGINIDTRALHAHLKKHGWRLSRSSGSHDVFAHDQAEHIIPVPRHRQLKLPLIKNIIKQSILDKETEKLHEMSDEHLVSYFNNINTKSAEQDHGKNEGVSMNQDDKQLDELNFFKTAPAAPKKFVSRVGTLPGQQDMTYRKNGETFTLHLEGDTFQLISNGQVVQSFNAPERDVQAHLAKEGYFLVKAPMTPTKTSSLGGPNWFKEGEEDEADYDNEYQNMVQRMAKKASDQERERGPVDIADLARKLRAISQKDQD